MKRNLIYLSVGLIGGTACTLALIATFGPRSSRTMVDLYTGTYYHSSRSIFGNRTGKTSKQEHMVWARKILGKDDRRRYPVYVCGSSKPWFGAKETAGSITPNIPFNIYYSDLPDSSKIALLLEYHGDLDELSKRPGHKELAEEWREIIDKKLADNLRQVEPTAKD